MWEAFLLQMNYFERYLEIELKQLLDPVVVRRPPPRKGRSKAHAAGAPQPVVDAVVVTLPVPAARPL